jgi:hypothetical protein
MTDHHSFTLKPQLNMSTPQANSSVNLELARLAQTHVDSARQLTGMAFDYSEVSLQWLDEAIAKLHPDGSAPESALLPYGAYVGETVRRLLGGVWVQDARGVALIESVGGGHSVSPYSWVQKRLGNGMEDSLAKKFGALKQQIGQVGMRLTSPADAPVTAEISAEESEALARSPLVVFLLVAAADGKVDKKELAAFENVIAGVMMTATPLLRKAMSEMLPEMDRHLEELPQRNPVEELQSVASILDARFPDEAKAFKGGLVGIGLKIAESSGGFLGFGSKVSEAEVTALAAIAVALGIQLE